MEAGFGLAPDSAARLWAPAGRPRACFGFDAVGNGFGVSLMPWFGEIHNATGIGGAVIALAADRRISLRTYMGTHPREIRVFSADMAVLRGGAV